MGRKIQRGIIRDMEHTKIHKTPAARIDEKPVFHKVTGVKALEDYRLEITFDEGTVKKYNVAPLFLKWDAFLALRDMPGLFKLVSIEPGGYAINWNEEIDLSAEELWHNGK
jgi:hypothetical protein